MTDGDGEYDPFVYVPDRIDIVTASGLSELHDALSETNRAKLRSLEIEAQGAMLWRLVEKGTIDVDLTAGSRR